MSCDLSFIHAFFQDMQYLSIPEQRSQLLYKIYAISHLTIPLPQFLLIHYLLQFQDFPLKLQLFVS